MTPADFGRARAQELAEAIARIGPDRVARLLINLAGRTPEDADISIETVNAAPALVVRHPELPVVVAADRDAEGRVIAVRLLLNPVKLGRLDASFPGI